MTDRTPPHEQLRKPPHSNEAEQSLLGAILLAGIDRVAGMVSEDDFYREVHRLIYRACVEIDAAGERVDNVTVLEWFKRQSATDRIDNGAYLTMLANETPGPTNMRGWAKIIREKALLRGLINLGGEISDRALSGEAADPLVSDAQERLIEWSGATSFKGPRTMGELAAGWLDLMNSSSQQDLLTTGVSDLDKAVMGMFPGNLIILAARPAMGKSSLAMQIAEYVGRFKPVMNFTLEMAGEELYGRQVMAGIPAERQRDPSKLTAEDWQKIARSQQALKGNKLIIDDVSGSLNQIVSRARYQHKRTPLGLIVIDYIQLIDPPKAENRTQEVSKISRALKQLAKNIGVPVLALSQLNREVDGRPNKRPIMKDLRESGSLEQDADQIWFIYRESAYHEDFGSDVSEIHIAKHRAAPTSTASLMWVPNKTRFENCDGSAIAEYHNLLAADNAPQRTSRFKRLAGGNA
jgi:replicative DNA helicase